MIGATPLFHRQAAPGTSTVWRFSPKWCGRYFTGAILGRLLERRQSHSGISRPSISDQSDEPTPTESDPGPLSGFLANYSLLVWAVTVAARAGATPRSNWRPRPFRNAPGDVFKARFALAGCASTRSSAPSVESESELLPSLPHARRRRAQHRGTA